MLDAVDGTAIISEMSTSKEDLKLSCALTRVKVILTLFWKARLQVATTVAHPQARLTYDP
jgi:hypothetical protein